MCPLTACLGVPPTDILPVPQLPGERVVATEVVANQHRADLMKAGGPGALDPSRLFEK